MRRVFLSLLILSTISSTCFSDDPFSTTISTALVEGDIVAGVGAVEFIDNLAINSNGDWMVEANTDFANTDEDGVLVINGVVLLREGIVGNINAPANSFVDSFDGVSINDTGNGGFNLFIDPLASSEDSGIYFNNTLVIQESDIATAKDLSPSTPYIGFFDTKINNNDVIMIMASVDDPAIDTSVDRAIVLADTVNGTQTVIAKEEQLLPGQKMRTVDDFGTGPHSSAFNDNDEVLYIAELSGDSTADNAIYLDDTLIAQEGSFSPDGTRTYDFLADRGLDLNNNGDYVFKANLSGDTSTDDVIILNDSIFKQEGDPAVDGFSLTGFGLSGGPVRIGDNGNVLWFGEWDNPNTDNDSGLFINDRLIVEEGITKINGLVVDTVNGGTDAFAMSSDGSWAIFEATLEGGINGAFLIEIDNVLLGDLNLDGVVDLLDVQPMVQVICCGSFQAEGDINCDGVVDLLDVDPFVQILTGI